MAAHEPEDTTLAVRGPEEATLIAQVPEDATPTASGLEDGTGAVGVPEATNEASTVPGSMTQALSGPVTTEGSAAVPEAVVCASSALEVTPKVTALVPKPTVEDASAPKTATVVFPVSEVPPELIIETPEAMTNNTKAGSVSEVT